MKYIKQLEKLSACSEAIKWCEDGRYPTLDKAWQSCERGDWMIWLIGKLEGEQTSDSRKKLVLVACECARLALPYVTEGKKRSLQAIDSIEMTERWVHGEPGITLEMVRAAANVAYAVYAAAIAADAVIYTANTADAERAKILKTCVEIVRKYYPKAPPLKES